jgi:hypothetical protein
MENNKQAESKEWNYLDFMLEIEYIEYMLSTRSYKKHYCDNLETIVRTRIKEIADRIKKESGISNNTKQLESLIGLLARYTQLLYQYN